jgi:hypothetical protein
MSVSCVCVKPGVKVWTTTVHAAEPVDLVNLAGPGRSAHRQRRQRRPARTGRESGWRALTIPCPGPVESLNASVAASVLLYEAARQRSVGNVVSHPSQKARRMGHGEFLIGGKQ